MTTNTYGRIIETISAVSFLILFNLNLVRAQNLQWAISIGDTGDEQVFDMAVDNAGNVYTTGIFQGVVNFDKGHGTYNLTANSYNDFFVCKTSPSGKLIWAKNSGSQIPIYGYNVAVDNSGNVYVMGNFNVGTIDFDPGNPGIYSFTSTNFDEFLLKLDSSGNFIWAKHFHDDNFSSKVFISSNSIYIAGAYFGIKDCNPGPGVFKLTSKNSGHFNGFILKLDTSGNFIWANGFPTNNYVNGIGSTFDKNGSIYLTGWFTDTLDFGSGADTFNLISEVHKSSTFIIKYNEDGNLLWTKKTGGNGDNGSGCITADNGGNIYICGSFTDTVDFDPGVNIHQLSSNGGYDTYILKLDEMGNFVWVQQSGGGEYNQYTDAISNDIEGNIYTIGWADTTEDLDPGPGVFKLDKPQSFLIKEDPSGNLVWTGQFGDTASYSPLLLAVNDSDNIYIAGILLGSGDFDPGPKTHILTSVSDNYDFFLLKLNQNDIISSTSTSVYTENAIQLYPNPADDKLYINAKDFNIQDKTSGIVSIYNSLGDEVKQFTLTQNQVEISTTGLNSGLYFLKFIFPNYQPIVKKLVVFH